MFIRFEYTSDFYKEQLSKLRGQPDSPFKYALKSKEHSIDLQHGRVTKLNYQKFKFEAMWPFASESIVQFINNTYVIQVRIKNCSANRVFLENLEFRNKVSKDLMLIDLNSSIPYKNPDKSAIADGDSDSTAASTHLFEDSVCFQQDEERSYLFQLKLIRENFKIDGTVQ